MDAGIGRTLASSGTQVSNAVTLACVIAGTAACGYMALAVMSGGLDFWSFWAAGRAAAAGLNPYAADVLRSVATPALPRVMPFYGPPFFATLMAPLSALPYRVALLVWTVAGLASGAIVVKAIVAALVPRPGLRNWYVVGLTLGVSPPLLSTIALGQTDLIVAGFIAGSWLLGRRHPFASGMCLCGALIDPHLATGFFVYYSTIAACRRDLWLAAGVGAGGAVLTALCFVHPELDLVWIHQALPAAASCAGCRGQITVAHLLASWAPGGALRLVALGAVDVAAAAAAVWVWLRGGHSGAEAMGLAALLTMLCTVFALNQDELILAFAAPAIVQALGRYRGLGGGSATAVLVVAAATSLSLSTLALAPRLLAMGLLPVVGVSLWPRRRTPSTVVAIALAAVWVVAMLRASTSGLVGGSAAATVVIGIILASGLLVWWDAGRNSAAQLAEP